MQLFRVSEKNTMVKNSVKKILVFYFNSYYSNLNTIWLDLDAAEV